MKKRQKFNVDNPIVVHGAPQAVGHIGLYLLFSGEFPMTERAKDFYKNNMPLVHVIWGVMILIAVACVKSKS